MEKFHYAGFIKPDAHLTNSRQKFIENVERQIGAVKDRSYRYISADGETRRPHRWVSYDHLANTAYIGVRFGSRFMRRNGIPFGVIVPNPTQNRVVAALKQILADARNGKLDADVVVASRPTYGW